MRYSSLSEKGRRPNNEDVVFTRFDPRYPLIAAVSDGMGGHAAGEVASRISIEALDMWTRELVDAPQNVLVDAFFNANAQVISAADADKKLRGMLCHVNLIPLNSVKERSLMGVTRAHAEEFAGWLEKEYISATVRREMGADIDGACGQLRRRVIHEIQ